MGESYINLGNPFLRKDFMLKELKLAQSLLSGKIKLESFYKQGSDNLSKLKEYTNKNSGFGFKGQTRFKKYPNLMVMYSPIQFGNNHPDSTLRTRNQVNFTMATLTWFKIIRGINSGTIFSYNNSKQSFSNLPSVSVTAYSLNQTLGIGKDLQIIFSSMYTKTLPSVDSVNSFSQNFGLYKRSNSRLTWNVMLNNVSYFHHGFRRGGQIGGSILLKNNSMINLQAGLNQIHRIWGIEDAIAIDCRLGVIWKL